MADSPVNPRGAEILGERVFASLRDVDVPIDIVEVFRPPKEAEAVAREAVAVGAKVLWFQPGTTATKRCARSRTAASRSSRIGAWV